MAHRAAALYGAVDSDIAYPQPYRTAATRRSLVGLLIYLAAEGMLFAGLISAFLVLRATQASWPPPGQPRLPVMVTSINTIVLLASGFLIHAAYRRARQGSTPTATRWLAGTFALGLTFLAVQGSEWLRLIRFGLSISSGVYGAMFYTLVGAHALHALAGVVALGISLIRLEVRRGRNLELIHAYWLFVVGVWPILFGLVYLG